ncbi:MAG: CvpA family protein [Kiritimatiellae bacterium]|nr:CvpA family protein [Kiritimatiellia bacterium]
MNLVDALSVLYVAFGAWRGRARGLADEGFRLLRMGVAFLMGCGIYGWISSLLKKALSLGGDVSGPIGFLAVLLGTWFLFRFMKKSLIAFVAARFTRVAGLGGAIAGGIRTLLIVLSVVGVLSLAQRDDVSGRSFVGKLAERVIPNN